ncbi:substrate-binding domain-containing protein [Vibrio penaeicida]|uniref:substrate-binding domain-containing protein n=1 Tax=Vibrio penaeicida TaxID=104609 RepID=UPI002734A5E9|nr:substrate-binding domain-containing protein [Vibrio penaeicida]MDP2571720.1 substrate-binding domain-containing protein [Vibrio penaeicida]
MNKIIAGILTAVLSASVCAADRPVIASIVFQSDTFMQTFQDGMKAAAKEKNVELLLGNSETDLAKEASLIDGYLVRDVDAIVINTFSASASASAVKEALNEGVTVVCANTCLEENKRKGIVSFLVTENRDLGLKTGKAAADYIKANLNGKAKIGILNCDTFPEACIPRKQGFLDALRDAGIEYEVKADQTGFLSDQALPISEAMLQAHPDINILWAANEGGTTAHVLAVRGLDLSNKVKVFGTDMSAQHAQFLKSKKGTLMAVTGQAPFQLGYDAINITLDALNNKEVAKKLTVPTILFARGDIRQIDTFMSSNGRAIFAN